MEEKTKKHMKTLLALATGAGITFGVMKVRESNINSQEISNPDIWHNGPIELPYIDLAGEPSWGSTPERTLYDFGGDYLIVLHDLARDGNYDQLEIQSCRPYRGHELGHIYMSREISPNAKEDEDFTLVDQSFFDTFNHILPKETENGNNETRN